MAEEELVDSSNELKGTTAVAFFHKDEIRVFVDSRESNEAVSVRGPNWKIKVYNTSKNWYGISQTILAVMVGQKDPNYKMRVLVLEWALEREDRGEEITVSAAASFIETYLRGGLTSEKKVYNFGNIIAGYDTTMGLQIYRVFIVEKYVENKEVYMYASFGSGATYLRPYLNRNYNFSSSDEDAEELGRRGVFNASFYDKSTDANINGLMVKKEGWVPYDSVQASEAYSKYYHKYSESRILFVLYAAKKDEMPIITEDLISFFGQHGEVLVAHSVDLRQTKKSRFYFHRLMYFSKEEVDKVLTHLKNYPLPHALKSSPILSNFSYQVELKSKKLFVEKASKQLLDKIISNSDVELVYSSKATRP